MLAAGGSGLAVDFVARQEHLEMDVATVAGIINLRRPIGLPALELPAQLTTEVEKMRQQCPGHSVQHPQHRPANVTLRGQTWLGLAAKEEYCSTAEFYSGQHAHCRAGIATYYSQDVTLLSGSVGS
ncbi:hypothetical protein C2E20_5982 [Micractinium conductrix]|uniref:Uncharacterized protein n=1 Tax=Micractinium conductrix TaxID=554055 RepID=A0A2P6V974_9CHLO|nr:hypothetical protein C2E20_5982 [Micractinium conductrix]|eukprot:PSC70631.1 hypothetical protein C2E20_5982 [Micractinium conductrix]